MNRLIFSVSILLLLVVGGVTFFVNVGDWLAFSEEPENADLIICLNGNNDRINKAVELFEHGVADHILATHVSMRDAMIRKGVPDTAVITLTGKHHSTFEEARSALQRMTEQGNRSAVIVSDGYHLYRARWTYERLKETEEIRLSYTASEPLFENPIWWRDKKSRKFVLNEIPKVAYYWIGHGLLGIETDPYWVNAAESWYNKLLDHIVSTTSPRIPIS